jgi:hypothetical protein
MKYACILYCIVCMGTICWLNAIMSMYIYSYWLHNVLYDGLLSEEKMYELLHFRLYGRLHLEMKHAEIILSFIPNIHLFFLFSFLGLG